MRCRFSQAKIIHLYVQCRYKRTYVHMHIFIVIITTPPENTTVCRGSDVTISCGYQSPSALAIRWMINDDFFTGFDIMNSDVYELNNSLVPNATSLTVLSINDTTTIQCVIPVSPQVISWVGTVTVISKYFCSISILIINCICVCK